MKIKKLILLLTLLISTASFGQNPLKDSSVLQGNFIRENIVGEWKDQNSTTIFKKNGTYSVTFDNGYISHGKWLVEKNVLSCREERISDDFPSSIYFSAYKILYFSPTKFESQIIDVENDKTIWIANKIIKKR